MQPTAGCRAQQQLSCLLVEFREYLPSHVRHLQCNAQHLRHAAAHLALNASLQHMCHRCCLLGAAGAPTMERRVEVWQLHPRARQLSCWGGGGTAHQLWANVVNTAAVTWPPVAGTAAGESKGRNAASVVTDMQRQGCCQPLPLVAMASAQQQGCHHRDD